MNDSKLQAARNWMDHMTSKLDLCDDNGEIEILVDQARAAYYAALKEFQARFEVA